MKVLFLVALVFAAVVCGVLSSSEEQQSTDVVYEPNTHVRTKRSPYDPFLPSLLLGKSFLLGAVLGPKLLHRRRYVHYAPRHVIYNQGWGWNR